MNAKAGAVKERLFAWAVFDITSKTYKIIISLVLTGGTQREYSSKPLKHIIVKRILVFKRYI